MNWQITHSIADFVSSDSPKINYSETSIGTDIHIMPDGLLQESGVLPRLAPEPRDIFSFVFFHLSRYEEYLEPPLDEHGRVVGYGMVHSKPIVDLAILEFRKQLLKTYPNLRIEQPTYQFINTLDIDYTFQYLAKPQFRQWGGIIKSLIKINLKETMHRISVLTKIEPDPADNFDYLKDLVQKYGVNTILFWLIPNKSKYDHGNSFKDKRVLNRLKSVVQWTQTGVHPSYASNNDLWLLANEKESLEKIINQPITQSRQHYIKLTLPETYRRLLQVGIREDYTMGYSDAAGFRAGTAQPFHWFDLLKNETTELQVIPFMCMDVTLNKYMRLTPQEAIMEIQRLIKETQIVGGCFVPIFHNSSLSDQKEWAGWRKVFEALIKSAAVQIDPPTLEND